MALHDPYREGAEVIFRDILLGKRTVEDPALKKCLNVEELVIEVAEIAFNDKIKNDTFTFLPMSFKPEKIAESLRWAKKNYSGEFKTLSFLELNNLEGGES